MSAGRPPARKPPAAGEDPDRKILLEKAQIIVAQERDIHLLRLKFNDFKQLTERTHALMARLSVLADVREALAMAAQTLVDDFLYEFAVASQNGRLLSAGLEDDLSSREPQIRRCLEMAETGGPVTVMEFKEEGVRKAGWMIGGMLPPQEDVPETAGTALLAGRTKRTSAYFSLPDEEEAKMFQGLLYSISQALSGVRYRQQIMEERNSLKYAAAQLRSLLVESHAKEKEISDLNNRLSVTLEGLGDGIVTIDKDRRVLFANGAAQRLLDPAPDEDGYAALERRLFVENKALYDGWIARAAAGEVVHEEASFAAGPAALPLEVTFSRVQDSLGQLWGYVQIARDLREIHKLRNTLQQSEKLSAMGQMAAGIAHEINNPLAVILGFSQSALKHVEPGDALHLPLDSINREALRCKVLVQDMLAFSRSSATAEHGPMDLDAAVRQAMTLVTIRAKSAGVEVSLTTAPGLPLVKGNNSQIQQVVVNLANNAVDALGKGGRLEISVLRSEKAAHVEVRVKDNGPGIPQELLGQIFDPFFTTKSVGMGTGLGLSLVKDIVEKHDGVVEVESLPGKGSTFTVRLPALASGGD
jgi:signal transduction histidine kinase